MSATKRLRLEDSKGGGGGGDSSPSDKEKGEFARRTWSHAPRTITRAPLLDKGPATTDPAAMGVFSTSDIVASCLLPYLDEFEDVLALSRLCVRTRAILQKRSADFIAFREIIAPFGRSHSIDEWRNREVKLIGSCGAFLLYKYVMQRYTSPQLLGQQIPVASVERILLPALDPNQTRLSRSDAFSFCKRVFQEYRNSRRFTSYGICETGKARARVVFCRGGADAVELHKQIFYFPEFAEPSYLVGCAIKTGVDVTVLAYFADNYQSFLRTFSKHHDVASSENFVLSKVVRTPNPEQVTYVLDRLARLYPNYPSQCADRLYAEGREEKFAVLPATLEILSSRGFIQRGMETRRIINLHHRLYNKKLFFNSRDSLQAHRAICAEYEWWDAWIKSEFNK